MPASFDRATIDSFIGETQGQITLTAIDIVVCVARHVPHLLPARPTPQHVFLQRCCACLLLPRPWWLQPLPHLNAFDIARFHHRQRSQTLASPRERPPPRPPLRCIRCKPLSCIRLSGGPVLRYLSRLIAGYFSSTARYAQTNTKNAAPTAVVRPVHCLFHTTPHSLSLGKIKPTPQRPLRARGSNSHVVVTPRSQHLDQHKMATPSLNQGFPVGRSASTILIKRYPAFFCVAVSPPRLSATQRCLLHCRFDTLRFHTATFGLRLLYSKHGGFGFKHIVRGVWVSDCRLGMPGDRGVDARVGGGI